MQLFYSYRHIIVTLVLFVLITAISLTFRYELAMTNIILIHLLPVIVIALRGDIRSSMIVTTLSIALLALYIPPTLSLIVHEMIYIWSFIIFYIVGYIITIQAKRIHLNSMKEILYHTLSHDLKTPLSSIMGNATFLVETHPLDPALRYKALSQIIESSRQMNRLISSLLDSARLQDTQTPLKKEWCDLQDLIALALREFRSDVLHERVVFRIENDIPLFFGDSSLLMRLFVNLIDNALKYSDNAKAIEISITVSKEKLQILFFNECPPIPQEELDNLFKKFYRAGNTADISGSGIGLSIARDITRAHHGEIRAFSSDHGIRIEVTLPILKRPASLDMETL
ncbi:ATP-binding protein [Sulfuricurvum sp.]|uniref:sensor histidine kinase n=1 Tax=Sulfuricurvum sp. TaxID=2025608 RepID=UPI00260FECFF|nr:ATP-binding protein [Sulfuricurvum sp.]MDD2780818.1 ATP-binding protein [Sulfuricurvum sp.]